jgi:hypothetical protein
MDRKHTVNWLEIIEVRSIAENKELLKAQMEELVKSIDHNVESVKIYSSVTVNTDFNIHLLHLSGPVEPEGSSLGVLIASNLKEFGLVNHRVWTPGI